MIEWAVAVASILLVGGVMAAVAGLTVRRRRTTLVDPPTPPEPRGFEVLPPPSDPSEQ